MRWFERFFRREIIEKRIEGELRFHLDEQVNDYIAAGVDPEEARRRAQVDFGGIDQIKEECREVGASHFLEILLQDVRYGLRMLAKNGGFTAVAVLTLALGIGANAAIFSAVYAVMLKPLPFHNAGELVRVFEANNRAGIDGSGCSYPEFMEWKRRNHVFSGMAAVAAHELNLTGGGDAMVARVGDVTSEFFAVLGVTPLLGRTLQPSDDAQGSAPVVVISNDLWRGRFGGDPNVIGRSVELDERSFTIIGVMPATFRFAFIDQGAARQLWIPIVQDPLFGPAVTRPTVHFFTAIARLRPGIPAKQAQAQMNALASSLWPEVRPGDRGWAIVAASVRDAVIGNASAPLLVLLAAVGLVLLIACANVTNLLLARATSRSREFAVRAALGASRGRLLGQLLTESVVLGLLGAAFGIGLAYWGVQGLSGLLPPSFPRAESIRVDGSVLAFALLLTLGTILLFGLAPALFASDPRLQTNLQESGGRQGEGKGSRGARNVLVISEVALAMVLLVGAGLLIRSFAALISVNPGFNTARVLKAEVPLPQFQYKTPRQWVAFSDELLDRVRVDPDLRDAAIALPMPLADQSCTLPFSVVNGPSAPAGKSSTADYATVSPNYFGVMNIPLLRGRYFSRQDAMSAPKVAIVSEALARIYFQGEDPIGRQLAFGFPPDGGVQRTIVGVVGDVRDVAIKRTPGPMMYVPFAQAPLWGVGLMVRTSASAYAATNAMRQAVKQVDANVPVTNVGWMADAIDASLGQSRLNTWLLGLFGAIALALAVAGIFGVISYSVSRRTHEFGIRMGLGAGRGDLLRLVVGQGLRLTTVGIAVGIGGAWALTRFLAGFLYGVRPTDLATYAVVAALLASVSIAACYIPARRAMRIDPAVALRHE